MDQAKVSLARNKALATAVGADDKALVTASYSKACLPEVAPLFKRFVPGPSGEMWVELFDVTPDSQVRFLVFDPRGRAIGAVAFPPHLRVDEAGIDYAIGVRVDGNGREHVVRYRVRRANE